MAVRLAATERVRKKSRPVVGGLFLPARPERQSRGQGTGQLRGMYGRPGPSLLTWTTRKRAAPARASRRPGRRCRASRGRYPSRRPGEAPALAVSPGAGFLLRPPWGPDHPPDRAPVMLDGYRCGPPCRRTSWEEPGPQNPGAWRVGSLTLPGALSSIPASKLQKEPSNGAGLSGG